MKVRCLTTPGSVPLSVLLTDTTSELVGLISSLSLWYWTPSREVEKSNFQVVLYDSMRESNQVGYRQRGRRS